MSYPKYQTLENKIIIADYHLNGDPHVVCECNDPRLGIVILKTAYNASMASRYTLATRALAKLETLPGFKWIQKV